MELAYPLATASSVTAAFLAFAGLLFADGPLVRPSPYLWKIVQGVSLIYFLILISLSFQTVPTVTAALAYLDPGTSEPVFERSYANSCKIYDKNNSDPWINIKDKFDVFVISHLFGWAVKTVIVRDLAVLWTASLAFEYAEVVLRHKLPNFYECWWDHILLDVLGCNLIGIALGLRAMRLFKLTEYDFRASNCPKLRLPRSRKLIHLKWLTDRSTFRKFCLMVLFMTVSDVNFFVLKAILNLETSHWICLVRTGIVGLAAAPAAAGMHQIIWSRKSRLGGGQAALLVAIIVAELILIIKWAPTGLPNWSAPMPAYAKAMLFVLSFLILAVHAKLMPMVFVAKTQKSAGKKLQASKLNERRKIH